MNQIRVLHIDDEPDLLADISLALGRSGFLVDSALSFTGWKRLLSRSPDVILLDIDMPGKSGFDLLAELKSRAASQNIPVLFLTAHSEKSSLLRGLREGLDDYVTKPCDPAELALRIQAVVRRTGPGEIVSRGNATVLSLLHLHDLAISDQAARLDSVLEIFRRACNLVQDRAFARTGNQTLRREARSNDVILFSSKPDELVLERILRATNRLLGSGTVLVPDGAHLERRDFPFVVAICTDEIEGLDISRTLRLVSKDKLFHAQ